MMTNRLALALPMLVLSTFGTASCASVGESTAAQTAPVAATSNTTGDCAVVLDAYLQADEAWNVELDRAEATLDVAWATVKGRNYSNDIGDALYQDEWKVVLQHPTVYADAVWDDTMTGLAATKWPEVQDEDLKSALREYSKGEFREVNMAAITAICPAPQGSLAGVVRVADGGVFSRFPPEPSP